MELVVLLWSRVILWSSPRATVGLNGNGATLDTHVTLLSPILAPGVPDYPIQPRLGVCTPPYHRDGVVSLVALSCHNACRVIADRVRVDIARNRASVVDLFHHGVLTLDGPILG